MDGRDFGSKPGSGGVMSSQLANVDRRERLRRLALETIDLSKDPYIMKNHLGSYECKLCLTLHNNEGNYLAHTQGKRHKTNLARRLAREQGEVGGLVPLNQPSKRKSASNTAGPGGSIITPRKTIKIGRPGYTVTKLRDADTNQRILLFHSQYPDIHESLQPRYRFMSAFEQRVETPPDPHYQYILFAADPYETIAFKIPNHPIDRSEGKLLSKWDKEKFVFSLQIAYDENAPAPNFDSISINTSTMVTPIPPAQPMMMPPPPPPVMAPPMPPMMGIPIPMAPTPFTSMKPMGQFMPPPPPPPKRN